MKNYQYYIELVLVMIITGIFSYLQIESDIILGGDEWEISYNIEPVFMRLTSDWNSLYNLGARNLDTQNIFPILVIKKIFSFFFTNEISFLIYHILWQELIVISLFIFLKKYNIDIVSIFIGILFYLFNEYSISNSLSFNSKIILFCLPLLTFFILKSNNLNNSKNIIYINLVLLFTIQTLGNISIIASIFLYILSLSFIHFYVERYSLKKCIIFISLILFFYCLINFLFLYKTLNNLISISGELLATPGFTSIKNTESADLFSIISGGGYWAARTGMDGNHKYVPLLSDLYKSRFYLAFLLIPFLLLFIVFPRLSIYNKKLVKKMLFVLILFVFFAKGIREPFGFIYHYLYNSFPLLTAFRDPWAKFIPYVIFSYIILISITMNKLSSFLKISSLIILLIFILIYVNKKIYYNDNYGVMRTTHVKIPEYWKNFELNFKKAEIVGRTLLLPKSMNGSYFWEHGISTSMPIVTMFYNNNIIFFPGYTNRGNKGDLLISYLYNNIFDKSIIQFVRDHKDISLQFTVNSIKSKLNINKDRILKLMNIMNINYILIQNDFNWYSNFSEGSMPPSLNIHIAELLGFDKVYDSLNIENNFSISFGRDLNIDNINTIRNEFNKYGKVQLYKIPNKYISDLIFSPININIYDNDLPGLLLSLDNNKSINNQLYIDKKISINDLKNITSVNIKFNKIKDSYYLIDSDCKINKKFIVVFNENYDTNWNLYINKQIITKHFKGNYYSQFWIVEPITNACNMELIYEK